MGKSQPATHRAFSYDVFVSYSSRDKKIVHALAKRLRDDGLRVWLDVWVIKPGDPISLAVQRGLEQSATLVMCMSQDYFGSEWTTLEHHTLLFRDPTNAQRRFIPLLLTDCKPPDVIAQFAYIDWRKKSRTAYDRLLAATRRQAPVEAEAPADQAVMVLDDHTKNVWGVAVTPDGKKAISCSYDLTLKVWELETGKCLSTLMGTPYCIYGIALSPDGATVAAGDTGGPTLWDLNTGVLNARLAEHHSTTMGVVFTPDGKTLVTGSDDETVKLWDVDKRICLATLRGHTAPVRAVAVTADGRTIISASKDRTLRIWDLATGTCRATLVGHTKGVNGVAVARDGLTVVSASDDGTLRRWSLPGGECRGTFEGHTTSVYGVALTPDGTSVVSTSEDRTVKVWNLSTGRCRATLMGHTGDIKGLAITPDGHRVLTASFDSTVRIWDLPALGETAAVDDDTRYANAKVVLVGESGVGKSGLALRLCHNRWEATESTHGMNVSRLELPTTAGPAGVEREVWLWDFAGQPDYRLIHQLYMDETALGLLVFDPQDDNPFEEIGYWDRALEAATRFGVVKILVAARCDRGGITISKKRFTQFTRKYGFADFLHTGAKTGEGCEELKMAIARHIPWDRLPWTSTSRLFKVLKDAIVELTESDNPLVRLPELRQRLQLAMPRAPIAEDSLRAVIGLLQGQGVVQVLAFGDFVLLQPEWINYYASVVVRMAREHVDEMGIVGFEDVLEGRLDYKDMKRLSSADEKILLRAMVQTLLDRSLCLREGAMLVFPSYFRRDKPDLPEHPHVFVTYGFTGPLDEIYATLVVRLSYSAGFDVDQLWKDAADFRTPLGKRIGLAMARKAEGTAELVIYFEAEVPDDTRVTFIKYVHEHLLARASSRDAVTRVRSYVCPQCNEPVDNRRAVTVRLAKGHVDIPCSFCEHRVLLLDPIEAKFGSDQFLQRVRELDAQAHINIDNQSRELMLVGHALAIAAEAGQIFRSVVTDWGIDGEIEFKDAQGRASGQRVYLQLKSDDSYVQMPRVDGEKEVFIIKDPRRAAYWLKQAYPVMLVIRTPDGRIHWMNVTEQLRRQGRKAEQITFAGEPFTAPNVARLRNRLLPPT